jgi:hypothetical protein
MVKTGSKIIRLHIFLLGKVNCYKKFKPHYANFKICQQRVTIQVESKIINTSMILICLGFAALLCARRLHRALIS